jgi:hypothetical protein
VNKSPSKSVWIKTGIRRRLCVSLNIVASVLAAALAFGANQALAVDSGVLLSFDGLDATQFGALVFTSLLNPIEYVAYQFTTASIGGDSISNVFFQNAFAQTGKGQAFEARFVVTPLPAALPLIASGLAALGFVGARRRKG